MPLVGRRAENHPQQVATRGALDRVDDRATRLEFVSELQSRLGVEFTLDVAASSENTKCKRFFTREDNGLEQSWAGETVWCNPPYSNLGAWVSKAWEESPACPLIVMLLPANRTEQGWWQNHVEPMRDKPGSLLKVEFLPGRMRFDVPGGYNDPRGNRPPFGCCLLIWNRN